MELLSKKINFIINVDSIKNDLFNLDFICLESGAFVFTRPKPAYGRQGLGWDRQARIQFRQVQFGMDTLLGNIYY